MKIEIQLSIFLINKPGVLSSVTAALAEAGVNLYALSLADSGEHGVLRVVCDNPDKARDVLRETHDRWTETEVLALPISNEPGVFAELVDKLAANQININYAYCTADPAGGTTTAIFKIAELKKAADLLG
jgi:hypothetical protein